MKASRSAPLRAQPRWLLGGVSLTVALAAHTLAPSAKAQLGPTVNPAARQPALDSRVATSRIVLDKRWDFEDRTLQGFTQVAPPRGSPVGVPVNGDYVTASQALDTSSMQLPPDPCARLAGGALTTCRNGFAGKSFAYLTTLKADLERLRNDLAGIGGNYWDAHFPIGQQGYSWVRSGGSGLGSIVSPEFEVQWNYLSFLVGGGCAQDVGVFLQTQQVTLNANVLNNNRLPANAAGVVGARTPGASSSGPTSSVQWVTALDASRQPIVGRGTCIENMARVVFDVSHLRGTKVRILIASKPGSVRFGHVNVDDIRLTAEPPPPSVRDRDPVWGVADLHAHLMNEKGYVSYAPFGASPEARALWGSALGPIENLRGCNDTHTTLGWDYANVFDPVGGSTYTLCRDMCLNLVDGAGLDEQGVSDQVEQGGLLGGYHNSEGGYPRFINWPMWYSAIHQQMHWSWVKRAHQGGLRLMVASVGNSEVISFALSREFDRPFMSDQDALALQIPAIKEFARQNSTWCEVALTPRDARRIMHEGKLAIIIGVELDHVMDSCHANVTSESHHTARRAEQPGVWASNTGYNLSGLSGAVTGAEFISVDSRIVHYSGHPTTCSAAQIRARVASLYAQGVRQIIPMHFSNNMLGGYAITDGLFFASAIFGNPAARPPTFMSLSELEASYGSSVRPPTGGDRERWQDHLPIQNKLTEIYAPMWTVVDPTDMLLQGDLLPAGPAREIANFFTGQCIEDPGWRAVAAFFSLGASEVNCGLSSLTHEAINAARSTMPWEGVLDTALQATYDLNGDQNALPFHVNSLGLTPDGETFLQAMMQRGMIIDIQHASDKAKNRMLDLVRSYPVMASHGGVQRGLGRESENSLSTRQLERLYAPPSSFASGVIGLGTQSARGLVDQLGATDGDARTQRGVALGTDLNGIDWHSYPRFGKFAYYPEGAGGRAARLRGTGARGVGDKVAYTSYPASSSPWASSAPICDPVCRSWPSRVASHPPLTPAQVTQGGVVTRTFDINYDGLAHYGLLPDFFQELSVVGATREQMGTLFRSAESTIRMWEENCIQAYDMPSPPTELASGCGPRSDYR